MSIKYKIRRDSDGKFANGGHWVPTWTKNGKTYTRKWDAVQRLATIQRYAMNRAYNMYHLPGGRLDNIGSVRIVAIEELVYEGDYRDVDVRGANVVCPPTTSGRTDSKS